MKAKWLYVISGMSNCVCAIEQSNNALVHYQVQQIGLSNY